MLPRFTVENEKNFIEAAVMAIENFNRKAVRETKSTMWVFLYWELRELTCVAQTCLVVICRVRSFASKYVVSGSRNRFYAYLYLTCGTLPLLIDDSADWERLANKEKSATIRKYFPVGKSERRNRGCVHEERNYCTKADWQFNEEARWSEAQEGTHQARVKI